MGRHKKPQPIAVADVLPTSAAARRLQVTPQNLSRLVDEATLTAYIFDKATGSFAPKPQEQKRKGQTYFFLREDLDEYAAHRHPGRREEPAITPHQQYQRAYYLAHRKQKRASEKNTRKETSNEFS